MIWYRLGTSKTSKVSVRYFSIRFVFFQHEQEGTFIIRAKKMTAIADGHFSFKLFLFLFFSFFISSDLAPILFNVYIGANFNFNETILC
jgi:hypothetical protein